MDSKRMIQAIRSNQASLPSRLSALERLHELGTPEALLGLCYAVSSQSRPLADRGRELIQQLDPSQCEKLLDVLLDERYHAYLRKRAFDILRREKPQEILRYVIHHGEALASEPGKARLLMRWLRQTKLIQQWVRHVLTLPLETALQLALALKQLDPSFPTAIARIVKNGTPRAQLRAMDILEKIAEGKEIVPFLISATMSENAELRSKAVLVLGRASDKFSFIANALQDPDPRVRANAVEAVWGIGTEEARRLLREAVRDPNNRVRANAARGLFELGHPLGLHTLEEMIQSADPSMRMSASWVLGEVKALEMIPQLRELLKDPDDQVRRNAAVALDKMGVRLLSFRRYFRLFREHVLTFKDQDIPSVARFITAARALVQVPEPMLERSREIVMESCPQPGEIMWQRLGKSCEERRDVAFLMAALFAKETSLRASATAEVGRYCRESAFFDISLEDDEVEVRLAAVTALCENSIPRAHDILGSCLVDPDPRVVIWAAEGLYRLEDSRSVEVLSKKLRDPNPDIRMFAAQAAGRGVVTPLKSLLAELAEEEPERPVRNAAAEALEKIVTAEERNVLRGIRVHIEHISTQRYPLMCCYVSVLGESGQVIDDLKRENFELNETGILERDFSFAANPRDVPLSVAILMDYSDFMMPEEKESVETGVRQLVEALPDGVQVALLKYASTVEIVQPLTDDREAIWEAIERPYLGATDRVVLYDTLFEAIRPMVTQECIRVAIVFTSGASDTSERSRMRIIHYAANHQVRIHIVQPNWRPGKETFRDLTQATNGQYYESNASMPVSVVCHKLSDILNHHYLLSYQTGAKGLIRGIATLTVTVTYRHLTDRMTVPLPKL